METYPFISSYKNVINEAGIMEQCLRELAALVEDPALASRIDMATHIQLCVCDSGSRNLTPSSSFHRSQI